MQAVQTLGYAHACWCLLCWDLAVGNHINRHIMQGWGNTQLPRHFSQPGKLKPVADPEAARAEFCEAGIPDEVTKRVMKQYQPYSRWDVETKLRPVLKLWVIQLGSQQLSERLEKAPRMLLRTPEQCSAVYLWLASIGADAEKMQQNQPRVIARPLDQVQNTAQAIQQLLQLTDEQLLAFLMRHAYTLLHTPEHVSRTVHTVTELLDVPVTSVEMHEVLRACGFRLFSTEPALVGERVAFFCEEFLDGQRAARMALKQNIYSISAATMVARAAELQAMLGWTEDELKQKLHANAQVLTSKPSTVANNIQKLQAQGFSSAQALQIFALRPSLTSYDWSSAANVQKVQFLKHVLQLSTAELTSSPGLLAISLASKIGARSEFVYRSKAIAADMPFGTSGFLSYIQTSSDARFADRFNGTSASPPLMYDEAFKQHWHQRWTFLTREMRLSVTDISACRALLFTSLPGTLAPRWHFLTLVEAAQADFKATNHLTALTTLSDEHFARKFNMANVGLVYNTDLL